MYADVVRPHMAKKRANTRVEPDTNEAIEKYREDFDLGESEALRRLIRAGLASEGYSLAGDSGNVRSIEDSTLERLARTAVFLPSLLSAIIGVLLGTLGFITYAIGDVYLGGATIAFGLLLIVGGGLIAVSSLVAQIMLARPVRGLIFDTGRDIEGDAA
jgi:hypothetical protein